MSDLNSAREETTVDSLTAEETRAQLARAEGHFERATSRLNSPVLAPWSLVPVVGRHLTASRNLASAAQEGTATATVTLDEIVALTDQCSVAGPERVTTMEQLGEIGAGLDAQLAEIDAGSSDALIGPLGDAIDELNIQIADARQSALQLEATSLALASLLEGPNRYLLLGANNAEMRNGSGMFLSASEVSFSNGTLTLDEVRSTADLVLPEDTVAVDGDLAENWPWLDPGRDLRNLGLTADLPQSAAVAVRTWAAISPATGPPVDGVIVVDVNAIRSLLRVVGPVEVDGTTYTADSVRGTLLRDQYRDFDGEQDARRDQLGDVARAIFQRLEAGEWKFEDLATELVDLVEGRNLMVWSADPDDQQVWSGLGADGHLEPNSLSIALVNRSGTKLDSWIETNAEVTTSNQGDGRQQLTVSYEIINTSTTTGPPYIIGPHIPDLGPGDQTSLVVANLPAGSTDITMDGAEVFLSGGDGPTAVIAGEVTIAAGQTASITIDALLPLGLEQIRLEPSARIPRTHWTINGHELNRDRRQNIDLATPSS